MSRQFLEPKNFTIKTNSQEYVMRTKLDTAAVIDSVNSNYPNQRPQVYNENGLLLNPIKFNKKSKNK